MDLYSRHRRRFPECAVKVPFLPILASYFWLTRINQIGAQKACPNAASLGAPTRMRSNSGALFVNRDMDEPPAFQNQIVHFTIHR